jgi:hypothetical protein
MLMAVMMSPREKWTDERLDDLSVKVDQGFAGLKTEMKEGFERMEARFGERFDEVDRRFEQVDKRFEQVDKRMARLEDAYFALSRGLWAGGIVISAAFIGGNAF